MDREIRRCTDKDGEREITDSISVIYLPFSLTLRPWPYLISRREYFFSFSRLSHFSIYPLKPFLAWTFENIPLPLFSLIHALPLLILHPHHPHILTSSVSPRVVHTADMKEDLTLCTVWVFCVCACVLWWMDRPWTNSSECYISSVVVLIHHYCT